MLKKLIRHELAETWKIPALIFVVGLLLSLACAIYFYLTPFPEPDVEINVGKMSVFLLYIFFMAAISLIISIFLGIRFYKNMYTDEGYLMHTLPVRPWMHIAAKTITGSILSYLAALFMIVSILPVTVIAMPKMAYITPEEMEEVSMVFSSLFGENTITVLFYLIPFMLVSSVSGVLLIYGAVCLGQLFGKHKVFSSILCYLGLNALISTASSLLVLPGMTSVTIVHATQAADGTITAEQNADNFLNIALPSMMRTTFFMTFLANILLAAVLFFLCNYLMKKCLNLD